MIYSNEKEFIELNEYKSLGENQLLVQMKR